MLKPTQVSSDSSLDSTLTHASFIEYSNISADNQRRSADNACNNAGDDPTPVASLPASLASSQSLLSLSDPLNCFIADLPLDMFQPVPLPTYNMTTSAQKRQASPMQSQQQAVSGNISTNFAMTRNLEQRNHPLGTRGTAPMTIESSKPNPISDEAVAQIVSNSSVPEFLYQLTKMLTDDHRDIIEWSNAKIEVHNPHRLESEVLNKYFRHSKYASFQRQLNYFGFRKLAGKGKMAPCSYVNENATHDLRSLLRMKRKTSVNATKETKVETSTNKDKKLISSSNSSTATLTAAAGVKRARDPSSNNYVSVGPVAKIAVGKGVKHRLNGYLRNTSQVNPAGTIIPSNLTDQTDMVSSKEMVSVDPHVIAKAAVGKGISHQFSMHNNSSSSSAFNNRSSTNVTRPLNSRGDVPRNQGTSSTHFTFLDPSQLGMDIESSLSELQNNYQNSLNEAASCTDYANDNSNNDKSGLRRESSLVALAMIPSLASTEPTSVSEMQDRADINNSNNSLEDMDDEKNMMMNFIDFPGEEGSIM